MAMNVFTGGRNQESVAYDLALALATRDTSLKGPEELLQRIADLLPACRDATKEKYKKEAPDYFVPNVKMQK